MNDLGMNGPNGIINNLNNSALKPKLNQDEIA